MAGFSPHGATVPAPAQRRTRVPRGSPMALAGVCRVGIGWGAPERPVCGPQRLFLALSGPEWPAPRARRRARRRVPGTEAPASRAAPGTRRPCPCWRPLAPRGCGGGCTRGAHVHSRARGMRTRGARPARTSGSRGHRTRVRAREGLVRRPANNLSLSTVRVFFVGRGKGRAGLGRDPPQFARGEGLPPAWSRAMRRQGLPPAPPAGRRRCRLPRAPALARPPLVPVPVLVQIAWPWRPLGLGGGGLGSAGARFRAARGSASQQVGGRASGGGRAPARHPPRHLAPPAGLLDA